MSGGMSGILCGFAMVVGPKRGFGARSEGYLIPSDESRISLKRYGTISALGTAVKKIKKTKKVAKKVTRKVQKRNPADLSPEADQWLAAALAEYNSKQKILHDEWGFGAFERWAFDTTTKTFTLHFADGTEFEADGQVLGTYCPGDNSWEWGWNNPNIEPPIAVPAEKLKSLGKGLRISYLTAGRVPAPTREVAAYLCAIGMKATDAIGVYLGGEPPVEAAIVLFNPRRKLKAA
jgi:hypothetical protein